MSDRNYNSFSGVDISNVFNKDTVKEQDIGAWLESLSIPVVAPLFNIKTGKARFPDKNPEIDKYLKRMEVIYVG